MTYDRKENELFYLFIKKKWSKEQEQSQGSRGHAPAPQQKSYIYFRKI
jgi:hypothetical protein